MAKKKYTVRFILNNDDHDRDLSCKIARYATEMKASSIYTDDSQLDSIHILIEFNKNRQRKAFLSKLHNYVPVA